MNPIAVSRRRFISQVIVLTTLAGMPAGARYAFCADEPAAIARRQEASKQNLSKIARALHKFHDEHKAFPPAVLTGPDGKTVYSWRVAILPALGLDDLHKQYNFSEPWDGPGNKKLLDKMPAVYRDPNDEATSASPSYFAVTGPETVFAGKKGMVWTSMTDGAAYTLMIVEAERDIPWTKPDDIPYAADKPLPKFGGRYDEGFLAILGDGSVRLFPKKIDEKTLRGWITPNGGERVFDPVSELR